MATVEKQPRPYWHVDAKWIFGIIFAMSLGISLLTYNLANITSEKTAVDTLTFVLASMYSPNGLDDPGDIEIIKSKMATDPNGTFQPIPNVNIVVKLSDVQGMTPREMRLFFFRQLAEPIYTGDIASLSNDPAMAKVFLNDTRLVRMFASTETHIMLQNIFLITAIISAICLIPFIIFSAGFGRLANVGVVLVYVSFLGALISLFLTTIHPPANAGTSADPGPLGSIGPLIGPLVPQLAVSFLRTYLMAFGIGVALLVLALIGKIIYGTFKKKVPSEEQG